MKKLAIVSVLLSATSFAQDFVIENMNNSNVIYRGFENKVIIGQIGSKIDDFEIETVNCEISKIDEKTQKDTYILKTVSSAKTATIRFVSKGQIVDSIPFVVQNLPSPALHWGNNKSGSSISTSEKLEMKYDAGVSLKANFEIVGWKCTLNDQNLARKGNSLSDEVLNITKSMAVGESILIEVEVMGTDGKIRLVKGTWVKS